MTTIRRDRSFERRFAHHRKIDADPTTSGRERFERQTPPEFGEYLLRNRTTEPLLFRDLRRGIVENLEKHNYDYGLKFVRRGYVVAAPCMIPFGRRVDWDRYHGVDPCLVNFLRMQALGHLPMAVNLRDLKWTLDFH